jgi:hypothetical protein
LRRSTGRGTIPGSSALRRDIMTMATIPEIPLKRRLRFVVGVAINVTGALLLASHALSA